jgi:hypothetical protein
MLHNPAAFDRRAPHGLLSKKFDVETHMIDFVVATSKARMECGQEFEVRQ